MVISLVNTRYIHSKIYTGVARYLLSWLVSDVRRRSRRAPMTSLVSAWLTWIYRMPMLAQQEMDLESSSWLLNAPCQSCPGWDWQSPQLLLCCPEWLRVGQARLWCCQAAVHWYPGPWFIWLQLLTWVNSWASSQHWRQASRPGKKTQKRLGKLGRSKLGRNLKQKFEIFQGWS